MNHFNSFNDLLSANSMFHNIISRSLRYDLSAVNFEFIPIDLFSTFSVQKFIRSIHISDFIELIC